MSKPGQLLSPACNNQARNLKWHRVQNVEGNQFSQNFADAVSSTISRPVGGVRAAGRCRRQSRRPCPVKATSSGRVRSLRRILPALKVGCACCRALAIDPNDARSYAALSLGCVAFWLIPWSTTFSGLSAVLALLTFAISRVIPSAWVGVWAPLKGVRGNGACAETLSVRHCAIANNDERGPL